VKKDCPIIGYFLSYYIVQIIKIKLIKDKGALITTLYAWGCDRQKKPAVFCTIKK
jgi:hypothetical protein